MTKIILLNLASRNPWLIPKLTMHQEIEEKICFGYMNAHGYPCRTRKVPIDSFNSPFLQAIIY